MKNTLLPTDVNEKIISATEQNTIELANAINLFDDQSFNTIPYSGSWTAGQIYDHLFMAENGMADHLFQGPVSPPHRHPCQYVDYIKEMFGDYSIKMQAPDFVLPDSLPKIKENLLNLFKENRKAIIKAVKPLDLSMLCLESEFPGYGYLTRIEWLNFNIFHAQRHIHQLNTISQILKSIRI